MNYFPPFLFNIYLFDSNQFKKKINSLSSFKSSRRNKCRHTALVHWHDGVDSVAADHIDKRVRSGQRERRQVFSSREGAISKSNVVGRPRL